MIDTIDHLRYLKSYLRSQLEQDIKDFMRETCCDLHEASLFYFFTEKLLYDLDLLSQEDMENGYSALSLIEDQIDEYRSMELVTENNSGIELCRVGIETYEYWLNYINKGG